MSDRVLRPRKPQITSKTPAKRNRRTESIDIGEHFSVRNARNIDRVNPAKRSRRAISTVTKLDISSNIGSVKQINWKSLQNNVIGKKKKDSAPKQRQSTINPEPKTFAGTIFNFFDPVMSIMPKIHQQKCATASSRLPSKKKFANLYEYSLHFV